MAENIKTTLIKLSVHTKQSMKGTLRILGLCKTGQGVVREQTNVVSSAVHTVRHLMTAEEID